MTLQNSAVCIEQLRIHAAHGVLPQEQQVGADFLLTIRVHYNIKDAMKSDNLDDTINYAELLQAIRQEMAIPSQLLEHAAARVCQAVFNRFPLATAIELKLIKQNPPMGADCDGAGVELYVTND